jgi:hypothetical protein
MSEDSDAFKRHDPQLRDELSRFEAELTRLRPREDRLDRERLAFLAGRASADRGSHRPARLLGLPLASRLWPAAFATMTSVAAVLLMMLVTRPADNQMPRTSVNDFAAGDHVGSSPATEKNRGWEESAGTLAARDALMGDIEERMKALSKLKSAASFSIESPSRPPLTPAAWRRVYDGRTSEARPSGSSGLPVFWRVTT